MKDHLGSIHAVINSTNTVISAQDYDAWGHLLPSRSYNLSYMKYDYTGKERDNETTYDYFGARYYDCRIGRWGGVDKMLSAYVNLSPYCFTANNPIHFIDPSGLEIEIAGSADQRTDLMELMQLSFPPELQPYLQLIERDGSYFIDKQLLNQAIGLIDNQDFEALLEIVNSTEIARIQFIDVETKIDHILTWPSWDNDAKVSLKDIFGVGLTLPSGNIKNVHTESSDEFLGIYYPHSMSKSGKNEIYLMNILVDFKEKGVTTLVHELLGHVSSYIRGQEYRDHYGDFDSRVGEIEERALNNFNNRQK